MKLLDHLNRPRYLTKALAAANNLISERGEANGSSMAQELISQYQLLDDAQRSVFYTALAEKFNPDPSLVLQAAQAYAKAPSAQSLIALTKVTEAPRQELFRRMNRAPGGTRCCAQSAAFTRIASAKANRHKSRKPVRRGRRFNVHLPNSRRAGVRAHGEP